MEEIYHISRFFTIYLHEPINFRNISKSTNNLKIFKKLGISLCSLMLISMNLIELVDFQI